MSDDREKEEQETATNPQTDGNTAVEPPEDDREPGSNGEEVQPWRSDPGEPGWSTGGAQVLKMLQCTLLMFDSCIHWGIKMTKIGRFKKHFLIDIQMCLSFIYTVQMCWRMWKKLKSRLVWPVTQDLETS